MRCTTFDFLIVRWAKAIGELVFTIFTLAKTIPLYLYS